MDLPIYRAINLIQVAQKEKNRDLLYQLYLVDRPYLKDQMSFNDYYEKIYPPEVKMDKREKDEIMEELLKIGGEM